MTLNDLLGALNISSVLCQLEYPNESLPPWDLRFRHALQWRTPQTAAVGGSKEEKRPDGRKTVLVFHSRLEIYCDIPYRRRGRRFTVCLWTVSRSHRVHLFKNQKHLLSSSFFLAKTNEKKKNHTKKSVWVVHLEAEMSVLWLPSSRPARARSCGDAVNPAHFFSLDLQPEGGTSPDFGGYQAGTQRISRNRGLGTSTMVPSLRKKRKNFWDLPSSRVAPDSHPSMKQSLLPVSSIFFCPPGGKKLLFTPHWT